MKTTTLLADLRQHLPRRYTEHDCALIAQAVKENAALAEVAKASKKLARDFYDMNDDAGSETLPALEAALLNLKAVQS